MIVRIALSFLFLVFFSVQAFASKAISIPMTVTLQDGRQVVVALRGDEHFSYWASSRGELIIREGQTWRMATAQEVAKAEGCLRRAREKAAEPIAATRPFPHIGTPKALVIFAEFADKSFTYPVEQLKALFNSTEYDPSSGRHSYSSLGQYFEDMSFGQYHPQFDFAGPYKLSGTIADYGKNIDGKDSNYASFVKDAVEAADADVDFSQYDADGDGYVDLVYILYAGLGENSGGVSSDCLWPKSGYGNYGEADGKKIYRWGINNELAGDGTRTDETTGLPYLNGIGVLAHEFCHTLGLPDFYPTAKWTDVTWYDNQSMEYWDLMDNGENNYNGYYPTPLTAWERELFGWMDIETLDSPCDVTLTPLQDGGKAYRIMNDNDPEANEYYIIESIPNGAGSGWYYRMRGNGMLVTHIDMTNYKLGNFVSPNNEQGHPRITIVPADGILMTSYRLSLDVESPNYIKSADYYADHAGDTYPGTTASTELTDYKAYYGPVDKPITEITQNGFDVSFKFMGGDIDDAVKNVVKNIKAEGVYNIAGQRVGKDYRGVVISNGKKIIRK